MKQIIVIAFLILFCGLGLHAQITVDFTSDITEGCGTVPANFTDLSTSTTGNIVSWNWDLASVSSMQQNPGRIFADPGIYTICLTVTDEAGNTATLCKDNYITVYALPDVDFIADPVNGCVPLTVDFKDLSSSANGDIELWIWGVGGSEGVISTSNTLDPIISTYTQADDYTVNLTVYDEKGCSATLTKDDFIKARGLERANIYSEDTFSCSFPHMASFIITNIQSGIDYHWDFGNGDQFVGTNPPPVAYDATGDYDIQIVSVEQLTDCRDTALYENYVRVGLNAEMNLSTNQVCQGKRVDFTETSGLEGATYNWEFGDGNASNVPNASHWYLEPGCYYVTLTKTFNGCEQVITSPECIEVLPEPEVNLTFDKLASCTSPAQFHLEAEVQNASLIRWSSLEFGIIEGAEVDIDIEETGHYPFELLVVGDNGCRVELQEELFVGDLELYIAGQPQLGCAPLDVTLTDSLNAEFQITSWEWTLFTEPPQIFTDESPNFLMTDPGDYDVSLSVETVNGCLDTVFFPGYVQAGIEPEVDFVADPLNTCADTIVSFTDLTTGPADTWYWLFGDGGLSYEQHPNHEYQDTGWFTVFLYVSHNGCSAIDTIKDYIHITPPIAKFEYELNCQAGMISLENTSVAADSIHWQLMDGNSLVQETGEQNPTFDIQGLDEYEVVLTVWNWETGCIDKKKQEIQSNFLAAGFTFDKLEGCDPLEIQVTDQSINAIDYEWKATGGRVYGDTLPNPMIRYIRPGIYPGIRLVVTDTFGCKDTLISEVIKVGGPEAGFELVPGSACLGGLFSLRDTSDSFGIGIETWEWVVGDSLLLLSGPNPDFSLDTLGTFPVTLRIIDSLGCEQSVQLDSALLSIPPGVNFHIDSISCVGAEIDFIVADPVPNIDYIWDFGDNNTSTGRNLTHSYDAEGVYTVCLSMDLSSGCDTMMCQDIVIEDPLAGFAADPRFADCPPLIVQFENNSAGSTQYLWQFGDQSGASDLSEPAHVYTKPGVFDVTLIAFTSDECRDTLHLEEYIKLEGPEGDFVFETEGLCAPVAVDFFGNSIDYYSYIWDFGDGVLDSSATKSIVDTTFHLFVNEGKYVPKLILIDTTNCMRTFTSPDTIIVSESVGADVGPPITICEGEDAFLTAQLEEEVPGMQYFWVFESDTICHQCLDEQLVQPPGGSYMFHTIHPNGCTFTDTLDLVVNPPPEVSITSSVTDVLCAGDTLFLEALSVSPGEYSWSTAPGLSCLSCPNPYIILQEDAGFEVFFTDEAGCVGQATVSVDVWNEEVDFAPEGETICLGDSLWLNLTEVINPLWDHASTLSCDTCMSTMAYPSITTQYAITGLNSYGCEVSDTLLLEVLPLDAVDAGESQEICLGELLVLDGDAPGPVTWSGEFPIADPTALMTTSSPASHTTYYLTLDKGLCSLSDSVDILVLEKVDLVAFGDSICPGEIAILLSEGNATELHWVETSSGLEIAVDEIAINVAPSQSADYTVVGSRSTCESDTAIAHVEVYPSFDLDLVEEVVNYPGQPIQLEANIPNPEDYFWHWYPEASLTCSSCPQPGITSDSSGQVFLTLINKETGCEATDSLVYRVLSTCSNDFVFVPNVFSPNGDGVNDTFGPLSKKHSEFLDFRVYDRWGNLIFESPDASTEWDGSYKGKFLNPGVYVYVFQVPCSIDNSIMTITGDITLVR